MQEHNGADKRFRSSRKLFFIAVTVASLLVLALTGRVVFTPEQILDFFKWLLGFAIGGHVITDVTSLVAARRAPTGVESERTTPPVVEPRKKGKRR